MPSLFLGPSTINPAFHAEHERRGPILYEDGRRSLVSSWMPRSTDCRAQLKGAPGDAGAEIPLGLWQTTIGRGPFPLGQARRPWQAAGKVRAGRAAPLAPDWDWRSCMPMVA